jgi:lysophospholipase L1-like esterase
MPAIDPDSPPAWTRWWVPAVLALATLPLILAFGPEYGNLQKAENAGKVREIVGDDRLRYVVAVLADFVFAACYGLAAFALSKRAGLHWWAPLGLVAVAVLDEAENVFVLINVIWANTIGDTPVEIMATLGKAKILALVIGGAVFLASVGIRHVWPHRHEPDAIPSEARRNARLAMAFAVFVATLAAFAGAVRIAAPMPAIVALGLVCTYTLGRLSSADRRAGGRTWPFLLVLAVAGEWVAVSVHGDAPDEVGFAALGAGVYAVVRTIDHARRKFTGLTLRIGCSLVAVAAWVLALIPVDRLRIAGAIIAILAGAAAVELWSASYPELLAFNRMATGFAGAALLVGVTWALYAMNGDAAITSVVVGALFVATALLITSNDGWIIVGVLLLAALWSGVPRSASEPPGQAPVPGQPYFAVLGDSYISGEGTDRYFADTNVQGGNECRRSPSAWPVILNPPHTHETGDVLGVPPRVRNESCSGAVTADIRQVANDSRPEPEQLAALAEAIRELGGPPKFVLISIGGNDAQFGDVVGACLLPGACTDFLDELRKQRFHLVGEEVARTFAEVRGRVGAGVPVIAVPYPEPLHVGDACEGVLLSKPDIEAINNFLKALNAEIYDATVATGSEYMGTIVGALADSSAQLCEPHGRSGLNFTDFNPKAGSLWATLDPRNWIHNFVHPNEEGHAALRAAALRWFADHPCVLSGSCPPAPAPFELSQLAATPAGLPDELENDGRSDIAAVVPVAVATVALFTLGWWLLITAVRPPKQHTTELHEGPAPAGDRPESVIERLSATQF